MIKDDENFEIISIEEDYLKVKVSNEIINIEPLDLIWFRRVASSSLLFLKGEINNFNSRVKMFELQEKKEIFKGFTSWINEKCICIGDPNFVNINKIETLIKANELSIECPKWILTGNKTSLISFMKRCLLS